ncbi:FG-GAP-like repeat-containing protein, partial [Leisingera sp. ANG-M7]|uniref:FG-GAP-like repeat-containing protein n=1 Tax=Leisingera sp. ANG-M7 TaxID=1577902 RepID=UPI00057D41D7
KYETVNGKQVEYFEVTNDKGVVYTYRALGAINGDTSSGDEFDALFRRKFLLTGIRDTQQTANTVTYNYFFESKANARAHRPASVTYANGYKVVFRYEEQSEPVATYAVGTAGQFGRQYHRLKSVFVRDDAMPSGTRQIRAYKLEYQRSAVTRAHQLSRVRLYGSDYTVDADSTITGGTQQPSPLKDLAYASDAAALEQKTYADTTFIWNLRVFDSDGDNRDELVQPSIHTSRAVPTNFPSCLNSELGFNTFAERYAVKYAIDKTGSRALIRKTPNSVWNSLDLPLSTGVGSVLSALSVLPALPPLDQALLVVKQVIFERDGDSVVRNPPKMLFFGVGDGTAKISSLTGAERMFFGNFDSDPEIEAVAPLGNYNTVFMDIFPSWKSLERYDLQPDEHPQSAGQITDIDGDGVSEVILTLSEDSYWWTVLDLRDGQFFRNDSRPGGEDFRNMEERPYYYRPFAKADVNGDAKLDLVYVARFDHARHLAVALSTGKNFLPPIKWIGHEQTSSLNRSGSRNTPYVATVADVNGDGLDDIIVVDEKVAKSNGCDGYQFRYTQVLNDSPGRVFLSTGTGFVAPEASGIPAIPGYIESGDFDGDGLPDFVSESKTDGSIWFGDGDVAHLLTGLTNGQGGETVVAYAPSTAIG